MRVVGSRNVDVGWIARLSDKIADMLSYSIVLTNYPLPIIGGWNIIDMEIEHSFQIDFVALVQTPGMACRTLKL